MGGIRCKSWLSGGERGFLLMAIGPIMSYPWNYWITGCEDTKRRLISLELLLELRKSMAKVRSLQNQNIEKVFSG